MRLFLGAALASTLLLASVAAAPARAQDADAHGAAAHGPLLSLSAYGESRAAPDMASITLGVTTQAPTAEAALRANADRMAGLLTALKRQGVAAKDIQTSNLSLNAQYADAQGKAPVLTGYQVANTVSVTVYDIARLGPIVDAVVAGGGNQVNGISFGLRDPQAAEDAARLEAVRRVQAKAVLYAKATGHALKGLKTLSEGGGEEPSPIQPREMARMEKASAPLEFEGGELSLRVDVQATYELEP